MARPAVVLSRAASEDLDAVFDHLFAEASPDIANLVAARLVEAMHRAAARPLLFRERPDYHPRRPRRANAYQYAILYEPLPEEGGIFVLRLLHESQDKPRRLRSAA
jgi:plasmid stabilization system protein ParE